MKVTGLFSGIGGFELGFERAGFEISMLVDIDQSARSVLARRFEDVLVKEDVFALTAFADDTEVVTAGFPCQDLSMAGSKAGIEGGRSSVVTAMVGLLEKNPVPVVVFENVPFMLHLEKGAAMRWLTETLEGLEYKWAYRVLDTMNFGLPHRRRRVYLVACRKIDPRGVLFCESGSCEEIPAPSREVPVGFYWTEGKSGVGFTVDGIPPLKVGSGVGIPSPPAVLFPDGAVLTPGITACERLQGFDAGWTDLADSPQGRGVRWRLVGNAVSVPVARWVASRILDPGEPPDLDDRAIGPGERWPNSAWNVGGGPRRVADNGKPVDSRHLGIQAFRDSSWSMLSDRALNGFIGRAENGGLNMPDWFIGALKAADRKPSRSL